MSGTTTPSSGAPRASAFSREGLRSGRGVFALVTGLVADDRAGCPAVRRARLGLSMVLLGGVATLAACGPSFQRMAAAECKGSPTDAAYAACERSLSQQLADERLGYIVRSQVINGMAGGRRP